MDHEALTKIAQRTFSNAPVVVLGTGSSLPHGIAGMDELQAHLSDHIHLVDDQERDAWLLVRADLGTGAHLEQALTNHALPKSLVEKIVGLTWDCVNSGDTALHRELVKVPSVLPLGQLFEAWFRSSNTELNVVTTNYDRVAEYACSSIGLLSSSGFAPGYLQPKDALGDITYLHAGKRARIVKIWKVHGSLDWFERQDGSVIFAPLFERVDETQPLIVTPGVNKYERAYDEPFRSSIQGADQALVQAEAYICVGFGFRDRHIEPKLVQRCREKNIPITIITKELTSETKEFLQGKAGTNFLAIEEADIGSRVYSAEFPDGVVIEGSNLWTVSGFLSLVT